MVQGLDRRPTAAGSRPAGYWKGFNDWWRTFKDQTGARPKASDVRKWYHSEQGQKAWNDSERPSLEETIRHGHGLRSVAETRDYFRHYRRSKAAERNGPDASPGPPRGRSSGSVSDGDSDYDGVSSPRGPRATDADRRGAAHVDAADLGQQQQQRARQQALLEMQAHAHAHARARAQAQAQQEAQRASALETQRAAQLQQAQQAAWLEAQHAQQATARQVVQQAAQHVAQNAWLEAQQAQLASLLQQAHPHALHQAVALEAEQELERQHLLQMEAMDALHDQRLGRGALPGAFPGGDSRGNGAGRAGVAASAGRGRHAEVRNHPGRRYGAKAGGDARETDEDEDDGEEEEEEEEDDPDWLAAATLVHMSAGTAWQPASAAAADAPAGAARALPATAAAAPRAAPAAPAAAAPPLGAGPVTAAGLPPDLSVGQLLLAALVGGNGVGGLPGAPGLGSAEAVALRAALAAEGRQFGLGIGQPAAGAAAEAAAAALAAPRGQLPGPSKRQDEERDGDSFPGPSGSRGEGRARDANVHGWFGAGPSDGPPARRTWTAAGAGGMTEHSAAGGRPDLGGAAWRPGRGDPAGLQGRTRDTGEAPVEALEGESDRMPMGRRFNRALMDADADGPRRTGRVRGSGLDAAEPPGPSPLPPFPPLTVDQLQPQRLAPAPPPAAAPPVTPQLQEQLLQLLQLQQLQAALGLQAAPAHRAGPLPAASAGRAAAVPPTELLHDHLLAQRLASSMKGRDAEREPAGAAPPARRPPPPPPPLRQEQLPRQQVKLEVEEEEPDFSELLQPRCGSAGLQLGREVEAWRSHVRVGAKRRQEGEEAGHEEALVRGADGARAGATGRDVSSPLGGELGFHGSRGSVLGRSGGAGGSAGSMPPPKEECDGAAASVRPQGYPHTGGPGLNPLMGPPGPRLPDGGSAAGSPRGLPTASSRNWANDVSPFSFLQPSLSDEVRATGLNPGRPKHAAPPPGDSGPLALLRSLRVCPSGFLVGACPLPRCSCKGGAAVSDTASLPSPHRAASAASAGYSGQEQRAAPQPQRPQGATEEQGDPCPPRLQLPTLPPPPPQERPSSKPQHQVAEAAAGCASATAAAAAHRVSAAAAGAASGRGNRVLTALASDLPGCPHVRTPESDPTLGVLPTPESEPEPVPEPSAPARPSVLVL